MEQEEHHDPQYDPAGRVSSDDFPFMYIVFAVIIVGGCAAIIYLLSSRDRYEATHF